MRFCAAALLVLGLSLAHAKPKNNEVVEKKESNDTEIAVATKANKGDEDILDGYGNDQMITACLTQGFCKSMTVNDARSKYSAADLMSVSALKGESEMAKALSPSLVTMAASLEKLRQQNEQLKALEQAMESLAAESTKGQTLNEQIKGRFAETMSKAAVYSAPQPNYKGLMQAPAAPSKGALYAAPPSKGAQYAAPPSKGSSYATGMQYESAMCPMTVYELGKSQKYGNEMKLQLESSNVLNARLIAEKSRLESELQAMKMLKEAAEQQSAFNAKYAAEQKSQAEMLSNALTLCNAEKDAVKAQKNQLELQLSITQKDLAEERSNSAELSQNLASCNAEKDDLSGQLAVQTQRAEDAEADLAATRDRLEEELRATQQELRDTKRALEDEQNAHATTQRILTETQEQLAATEAAKQELEEAKQKVEDELAETKSNLEIMTAERDQLQTTLDATSAALAEATAQKMQCESNLAAQTTISEELRSQLADALAMLKMEKEAREQLASTIALVQETSMKVQEEVQKLQAENALLQQQAQKLKNEQEVAMAMAAGCPPTYEKFGSSCYKYVREKTPWKSAQEQCMKDQGNLVAIESTQEQIFLTNYLKRHGATDAYSFTGGLKYQGYWKWLGQHSPMGPIEFWYNAATKSKANYDCQAMYVHSAPSYGQWVGLPCYTSAPYVCEYQLLPAAAGVQSDAEQMAILQMAEGAPAYLRALVRY